MHARHLFALGSVLLGLGSLKIWLHLQHARDLAITTCLGQTVRIPVAETSFIGTWHCWGCYAAALGTALIFFALRTYQTPRPVRASSDIARHTNHPRVGVNLGDKTDFSR